MFDHHHRVSIVKCLFRLWPGSPKSLKMVITVIAFVFFHGEKLDVF